MSQQDTHSTSQPPNSLPHQDTPETLQETSPTGLHKVTTQPQLSEEAFSTSPPLIGTLVRVSLIDGRWLFGTVVAIDSAGEIVLAGVVELFGEATATPSRPDDPRYCRRSLRSVTFSSDQVRVIRRVDKL